MPILLNDCKELGENRMSDSLHVLKWQQTINKLKFVINPTNQKKRVNHTLLI